MKKYQFITLPLLLATAMLATGCSELKDSLPNPVTPGPVVHQTGWIDSTGHGAGHGAALKQVQWNSSSCKSCHGGSYGGGSSGVSCYTCHPSAPHDLPFGTNPNGHGVYLIARGFNTQECKICHGVDYSSGNVNVACYKCHASFPHEVKFSQTAGGHQSYLHANGYKNTECQQCHGATYAGGAANVTCFNCHDAYPHEVKFSTALGSHPGYVAAHSYSLQSCRDCHGVTYAGGSVNVSCSSASCHATASGTSKSPEACNTCHGQFRAAANDTLSWAPPRALNGDTSLTAHGVGAHTLHLTGTGADASNKVPCSSCHVVPTTVNGSGHLDGSSGAEVVFSGLANFATGGVASGAAYISVQQKCNNTYCHGAWTLTRGNSGYDFVYADTVTDIKGNSAALAWTGGSSATTCGSCHGLPPTGHRLYSGHACGECHTGVSDASNNIIDKTKHMNGKVNVFGLEYSFR